MKSILNYLEELGKNQKIILLSKIVPLEMNVSGVKININNNILLLSFYNSLIQDYKKFSKIFSQIPNFYKMLMSQQTISKIKKFSSEQQGPDYGKNAIWEVFNIFLKQDSYDAFFRKKGQQKYDLFDIIITSTMYNTNKMYSINIDGAGECHFPEELP